MASYILIGESSGIAYLSYFFLSLKIFEYSDLYCPKSKSDIFTISYKLINKLKC